LVCLLAPLSTEREAIIDRAHDGCLAEVQDCLEHFPVFAAKLLPGPGERHEGRGHGPGRLHQKCLTGQGGRSRPR